MENTENPLEKVQTPDLNKERLETLKKLFPDLFTNEGQLNINELKKVIDPQSVGETERYEFRWFGKSAAKRNAFSPSNATLIFDEKRSVNPTESENLIIEGENLEVLKLLTSAYREKIKCIYIDPPYNTGKDFVYSDNYSQDRKAYWEDAGVIENGFKIDTNTETDGRFHSNWLNMMYSRLLIARQLLREDGVIFISIDDTEVHHLRKLCDEAFGEENFLSDLIWNLRSGTQAGHFTRSHEYILCYAKSREGLKYFEDLNGGNINHGALKKISAANPLSEITFPAGMEFEGEDAVFEGELGNGEKQILIDKLVFEKGKLKYPARIQAGWAMRNQVLSWLNGDETFDTKGQKVLRFYFNKQGILWYEKERGTIHPKTILPDAVGNTKKGGEELINLIGTKALDFPKPSSLIHFLAKLVTKEDDIVLDFFAGSGTTGHAVSELNKEDDGNRKFILVQIPEATDDKSEAYKAGYKKITDITIERNKRVVEKIIEEKKNEQPDLFTNGKKEDSLKGLGFKVFKLVKSNFPRVEFAPDPEKTTEENIELLKQYIRDKEAQLVTAFNRDELMTEILLKNGFTLNYTITKQEEFKKNEIFLATDGEKETLICLNVSIDMETVEHFKKHNEQKFICLERALDTTKKWNLKHYLDDKFNAF